MKIKFKNIELFIKKYFITFGNIKVTVLLIGKTIEIKSNSFLFGIEINPNNNLNFGFDNKFKNVNNVKIEEISNKLLIYINNNFEIPISLKLSKKLKGFGDRSIFILGNDGNINNFSEEDIKILKLCHTLYTNNVNEVQLLLKDIGLEKINILNFDEIYKINIGDFEDIILFNYGDYLENNNKNINDINLYLNKYYENTYLNPYYSNFINKYSLSHSNYGSLFYNGVYNFKSLSLDKGKIILNLNNFIFYSNLLKSKNSSSSDTSFGIDIFNYDSLIDFINLLKSIKNINNFIVEILFETNDGYFIKINNIFDLDISNLNHEKNISNISLFIYDFQDILKLEDFLGYEKFHSINSGKTFTFLSAPLSRTSEFTKDTINYFKKSKYIFGETVESIRNFYDRLNITYDDKKIFFADDLILMQEYLEKENKKDSTNYIIGTPEMIINILPELNKLLLNGEKCYYITDGGTPCILDPGDYIKKYIGLRHKDYSILAIKGPSIIPTVLLGCKFTYETIFWAPLIYKIEPEVDLLSDIKFFSKDKFGETLIIFYSFGYNIVKDMKNFRILFNDINIQILGDLGTEREYNKLFSLKTISKEDIGFLESNSNNIVYLLKY